jgi:quinol monooxygenase YgiN
MSGVRPKRDKVMRRQNVTVLVQLRLRPDCIEQGKADLLDFARIVRKTESDCLAIEIAQDIDDATSITMIEKWSNRAAYEGPHLQTPHMKSFVEQSGQYFDGSARICFCEGTVIGEKNAGLTPPYGR